MKYSILPMNNNDNTDSECMICHCGPNDEDNPNSNKPLISVVHINYLHKECYCNYKLHKSCLEDWLSKRPACPICNLEMFYLTPDKDESNNSDSDKDKDTQENSINKCFSRLFCCACSSSSTNSRNKNNR